MRHGLARRVYQKDAVGKGGSSDLLLPDAQHALGQILADDAHRIGGADRDLEGDIPRARRHVKNAPALGNLQLPHGKGPPAAVNAQ